MTRKSIALRSRGFVDGHTTKGKGPIYRLRNILPIPLVLLVALWSEPTLTSLGRGGICLLLGEIIRLWSAGYIGGLRLPKKPTGNLGALWTGATLRLGNLLGGARYCHYVWMVGSLPSACLMVVAGIAM